MQRDAALQLGPAALVRDDRELITEPFMLSSRWLIAAAVTSSVVCAQAQTANTAQTPAAISAASTNATVDRGLRVHSLPPAVRLKIDASLPCAGSKTLKLSSPATASAPPSAARSAVAAVKADELLAGEAILIQTALSTGRPMLVNQASCDAQGAIVGAALSLEPLPSAPANLCAMPHAKEKLPQCR
jgi:hypothetical protein